MKKFLTIAAVAILAASCGSKAAKKAETSAADSLANAKVEVKVDVARTEQVEHSAVFTSNIEAFQQNNIAPSMPLRIDRILVDVGSKVSRGQLLATMDATQYNQIAVQLANTQADYDRIEQVQKAGGISKQMLDQAAAGLKVQRTQAANLLENTQLRSPISGVVTARNFDAGDMYSGAKPILTVMQIDKLKVTLSLSEQYFPMVTKGMDASIKVDMYPEEAFPGKVSLIAPAIDPSTRTFTIEVEIPNPKGQLRPGMFSRTQLVFGSKPGIMVEDIAIQRQLGTNDKYLFIARGGKAERVLVKTGTQIGSRVEITEGVTEGDQVVTAGISRLMNGTNITIM